MTENSKEQSMMGDEDLAEAAACLESAPNASSAKDTEKPAKEDVGGNEVTATGEEDANEEGKSAAGGEGEGDDDEEEIKAPPAKR